MTVVTKIVGWGQNTMQDSSIGPYSDIVMDSTDLSVEEGNEKEANIEGGSAEARDKEADKYILKANRRIDDENEVEDVLGFTPEVDMVECTPDNGGLGVRLAYPSRHVAVKMDSKDGLVAVYTYKTKGLTDGNGKLTDVSFVRNSRNVTYTAVSTSSTGYNSKNPKTEGWYIKNGSTYYRSFDTTPQSGMTYYTRSVTSEG